MINAPVLHVNGDYPDGTSISYLSDLQRPHNNPLIRNRSLYQRWPILFHVYPGASLFSFAHGHIFQMSYEL
jgi:hypothetical protein